MAEATTSHIVNSTHRTLRSPHLQFPTIYSRKWRKRELTIPSNPINIPISGIDTGLFFTAVMLRLYAQCLSLLTELGKQLGGDLMFGRDWGMQGVKNVLDVGGRGTRVLARQSTGIGVLSKRKREEGGDGFLERTGKPPPGPGGKELSGRGRGVHCGR
ncbi:hypothetical protein HOY80DRAFT_662356 [Tuber brumale]|nr:hypothetical protein HOY80DRAFT_662356 [Tuber brumale]